MILAAGRGERMRELTEHCPKPMLPVGGRPLIDHHLEKLALAGVKSVVVNVAWCADVLTEYLDHSDNFGLSIEISHEPEGLETGGGIFNALPLLGSEPFIAVNGDVWSDYDYSLLAQRALLDNDLIHLVMVENPEHNLKGDFDVSESGRCLIRPKYTFSGLRLMRAELLSDAQAGKFSLVPFLRAAITGQQATAEIYSGRWLDVGTPERLEALNEELGLKSGGCLPWP